MEISDVMKKKLLKRIKATGPDFSPLLLKELLETENTVICSSLPKPYIEKGLQIAYSNYSDKLAITEDFVSLNKEKRGGVEVKESKNKQEIIKDLRDKNKYLRCKLDEINNFLNYACGRYNNKIKTLEKRIEELQCFKLFGWRFEFGVTREKPCDCRWS